MESLAVKYRPDNWDSVVGQDVVVDILRKQVQTGNLKNSYIFSGASGCGKTTVARIFANDINGGVGTPIEIDGASNNGVDNVKNIVNEASQRSLNGRYKIYIIDEAHMLTVQAWNAFLKTIEESPRYTIFIFCTTDPQKIPDTIKNRCMRFNFNRISSHVIFTKLNEICESEGIPKCEDVTDYISRVSHGELRNAISKLETCIDFSKELSIKSALMALGESSYDTFFDLINSIVDGNFERVDKLISGVYRNGEDIRLFVTNFLNFTLDIMKYSLNKNIMNTGIPITYKEELDFSIGFDESTKYYNYYIDRLLDLKNMLKNDNEPYQTVEVMFNRMCRLA